LCIVVAALDSIGRCSDAMLHVVDKVDGVEMRDVVANVVKAEARGTVVLRQPIPDRPELEQRFTKVLVCSFIHLRNSQLYCVVQSKQENVSPPCYNHIVSRQITALTDTLEHIQAMSNA